MNYYVTVATEPGYYENGQFGVRIENVVLIKQIDTKHCPQGKSFLTMEPVTLVIATVSCDPYATPIPTGTHSAKDDNV